MGLIKDTLKKLKEKRQHKHSVPQKEVQNEETLQEEYEQSDSSNIEAMKELERRDFLSRGNYG